MSARLKKLTIGTRGSPLALVQTDLAAAALRSAWPGLEVDTLRITTKGDILLDQPLSTLGDKGLFVVEIEAALRDGRADLAVHSAKDLPSELPVDMRIAAFARRADPRDALVSRFDGIQALPVGARVGTSSPRRSAQLKALRPDIELLDVRGNVGTRLRKLADGGYDALLLAAAGLERLGVRSGADGAAIHFLPVETMLPAPGQGALAIEVNAARPDVVEMVRALNDPDTEAAVLAERAFLGAVGGGCSSAVAAHARVQGATLSLHAMIGAVDGRSVRGTTTGGCAEGPALAAALASKLLAEGGAELLRGAADVTRA
ncbi:MAG TPA: hydroxymethylbilane synthase [Gemmatimonadales bacterium]|nr:hydroxymethylbilane synthase [Gemmatimonadales bacterium]